MKLKYKMIFKLGFLGKNRIKLLASLIIGVIIMTVAQSCSASLYSAEDTRQEKIENSEQYDDGKFKNKKETNLMSVGSFFTTMWEWMFGDGIRTPEMDLPSKKLDWNSFAAKDTANLKASWMGHSSVVLNLNGKIVLTDPVYENSVSFVGPSRFNDNLPLNIDEIKEIDLVVISHNHMDHLNFKTIKNLKDRVKYFAVPLGVGSYLEDDCEVPVEKIIELDWWEEFRIDDELFIAATPAQHFSGRGLTDSDKSLWASWVIKGKNHSVYFTGDSGYFSEFKNIGEKYGPFDLTMVECGQYNEKWKLIHMMPEESVQAHVDVKGKYMLPIHWGAFRLSFHDWFDPINRAVAEAEKQNVKLTTPIIGEVIDFQNNIPSEKWWLNYIKDENNEE